MASLYNLPPELVIEIFSYLHDVKPLRLTNRRFNGIFEENKASIAGGTLPSSNTSRDGSRQGTSLWIESTFALFVLVKVSNEEINRILQEAYDGSTVENYMFWLADHNLSAAPRYLKEGDITYYSSGTEPPIPSNWSSPFVGKSIEDVAAFLKRIPDELCVDWHHFGVLGDDFLTGRVITFCRIGDEELRGDELSTLPVTVASSTLRLSSMKWHQWEEDQYKLKEGLVPIM